MKPEPKLTPETRLAQAVWVKAHQRAKLGQPAMVLSYKTSQERERVRLKLYNSVRAIRKGELIGTPELREAVANVQILQTMHGGEYVLLLQAYEAAPELLDLARQAGVDFAEVLGEGEPAPGEDLLRLLAGDGS